MAADPYTAFFGGVGQGVGKGLGNAMSDTGVTSNTASSATYGTQLGGTGWTINFGGGAVDSSGATNRQTAENPPASGTPLGTWATGAESSSSGAAVAVAGVVVLLVVAIAYRMRKGR